MTGPYCERYEKPARDVTELERAECLAFPWGCEPCDTTEECSMGNTEI